MAKYSRKQLAAKALRLFSENYNSGFTDRDFNDKYRMVFNSNSCSFTITWLESDFDGNKYRYDIDLFLGFGEPQVTETKMERILEKSKILE